MSVGKGGQRSTSSGSTVVDATTQDYLRQVMEAAKRAGGSGGSGLANDASKYFTDLTIGGLAPRYQDAFKKQGKK